MTFDFRGTALELCSRPGCCHYHGEHDGPGGSCTGLGRGPDGLMDRALPKCRCLEFIGEGGNSGRRSAAESAGQSRSAARTSAEITAEAGESDQQAAEGSEEKEEGKLVTNMEPAGYGSASGAIKELEKTGAIEGVHYRLSRPGESITEFIIAIDNGPMVVTMKGGFDIAQVNGPLERFAILNADGMEYVGAGMAARQMRDGKIPAEAAYVLAVE